MTLLSICIPTYNRAVFLKEALDSILPQVAGDATVEVLVSDNASTDGTQVLVEEYRHQYSQLRYRRHPQNVGFDANVVACIENASGEYTSLFSDDDVAMPGLFPRVVQEIVAVRPAIICANLYPFRGRDPSRGGKTTCPQEDIVFEDGKEFFFSTGLGFISVLTFRTAYARQFIPDVVLGTGNAHLDMVARIALCMPGPFSLVGTRSVAARAPTTPTYDSITSIYLSFAPFLHRLHAEGLLETEDIERFLDRFVKRWLWKDLLRKKCTGDYAHLLTQRPQLREYYGWHPLYRFYERLIFLLPRPLFCPAYRAVLALRKRYLA